MMKYILILFSLLLGWSAWAVTFDNVQLVGIIDGDTIKVTLPGIHPLFGERLSVRIRGIDTPEIRGKCEVEKTKAKKARDYLRKLLKGAVIQLIDVERGKYFRIVATVKANGLDVAAALIQRGLGRPYDGGKRLTWCSS